MKNFILPGILMSFIIPATLSAQTVEYPQFTVPVYRYAADQRYSEHKSVFYMADINPQLGNSLFPSKNKKFEIDSFHVSVLGELRNAGIEVRLIEPDLNVAIMIESFSASPISNGTSMMGNTTYNVSGKAKLVVLNNKGLPYISKPVELSEMVQLASNDVIKNNFTRQFANSKAAETYTLLVKSIIKIAAGCEENFINSFKTKQIRLTSIYRAQKKYPDLTFLDSLNTKLVDDLKKKSVTGYKQFIVPYENEITGFMNREFPRGYSTKNIQLAGHYTLAFLYYLAYDSVKLKQTLEFLYENSNKFLGNRIQYSERQPLLAELQSYYASLNEPKIQPISGPEVAGTGANDSTDEVKTLAGGMGTEILSVSWMVTEKGDTLHGKHVVRKMNGTIIDLDGNNKVLFEYENDKGKTVRKSFKYSEVKTLYLHDKTYESHKFKPTLSQSQEASLDLLRGRMYMMEVVFACDKIKFLKDSYGESPSNAILFIRPGEEELANQGKNWQKNKATMMKQYFKDCAAVLEKLDKESYNFSNEQGYLQLAQDYKVGCN